MVSHPPPHPPSHVLRHQPKMCKCNGCYPPNSHPMCCCVASTKCGSATDVTTPPPNPRPRPCVAFQVCKSNGCYHPPPHYPHPICCVALNKCANSTDVTTPHPTHCLMCWVASTKCASATDVITPHPTCHTIKKNKLPGVLNDAGSKNLMQAW